MKRFGQQEARYIEASEYRGKEVLIRDEMNK